MAIKKKKALKENKEKSAESEQMIRVRKIANGTVIDHIPRGKGSDVLRFLGIDAAYKGVVTLLMNVQSRSMEHKDIVKIEDRELGKRELDKIAIFAPTATINVVRNFEVVEKYKVKVPDALVGSVECPNPTCITHKEGIPRLLVEQKQPLKIRCAYCERVYSAEDLKY
ncbi:MAG: aspartate carbamoyltransferase regulatory subunit [Candidatus Norongarragalinales archaeon]